MNNGGFGILYRAKYTETGNYIAAKILKNKKKKQVNQEIAILIKCSGLPTFNLFYGYSRTDFFNNNNVTLYM